jgi:hypothetical protein
VGVLLPTQESRNWKQIIIGLILQLWRVIILKKLFRFGKEWQKWQVEEKDGGQGSVAGQGTSAFFSDHPSDQKRIKKTDRNYAEALTYYLSQLSK